MVKRPGVARVIFRGEEELHVIGPPQVEILANDTCEKLPPAQRPIADLREADVERQERQLIAEAPRLVDRQEGERDLRLPAGEERLDIGLAQRLADRLEHVGLRAAETPVIQRGKSNASSLQLPLRPFVPIEAELDRIRRVAADLDERRPPLWVEDVDGGVVRAHRFPEVDECRRRGFCTPTGA